MADVNHKTKMLAMMLNRRASVSGRSLASDSSPSGTPAAGIAAAPEYLMLAIRY